LAQNYETEFQEMLNGQFGPTSPANTPNPSFTIDGVRVESFFSPEDGVMPRLVDFARAAQSTLHFMAFSFTDDDLASAMIERAGAGVEVLGIFEQRGANTEFSSCPPLLSAGLDVRLDGNPRTFHHKVVIVDGAAVAIGSFNYSSNASESNDENLIIVHDPSVASQYEEEFNRRWAEALLPVGGQCLSE
jgi:phosphatidylserine/phosphatidylglycerophosphate/cardiolipin synthase-like enzyme